MKSNPKPRGELEILLIVLGVLCLGLGAALAVQRPVLPSTAAVTMMIPSSDRWWRSRRTTLPTSPTP